MLSLAGLMLWACESAKTEPEPCDGAWPVWTEDTLFGRFGNIEQGVYVFAGYPSLHASDNDAVASIDTAPGPVVGENNGVVHARRMNGDWLDNAVEVKPIHIESGEPIRDWGFRGERLPDGRHAVDPFTLPEPGGWRFELLSSNSMSSSVLWVDLCVIDPLSTEP